MGDSSQHIATKLRKKRLCFLLNNPQNMTTKEFPKIYRTKRQCLTGTDAGSGMGTATKC
jgi:hypothetical protein